MTSIVGQAPASAVEENIPMWLKFDWSPELQQKIYSDWGTYYLLRGRENLANYYYTKALELDSSDYKTLHRRSQAQRKAARIEGALSDARQAQKMALMKMGPNAPINMEICDALIDLNQFEYSNYELQLNVCQFEGIKAKSFLRRVIVVNDVIKDVTGKAMSLFFLRNQKLIQHVRELNKAKEFVDSRPLWKILWEQAKCDILSIPEEDEEILPPLEIARRKRAFNVLHQTYMNDSWHDILFMKNMKKNPSLLLEQCKKSKYIASLLSTKQYEIVRQFIKMLQCRSPLYYVRFLKYPNKKLLDKNKQAYLYRIQYQTHRHMIADLRYIRKLREQKRIESLNKYVEKIMGEYYVTKTNRVMCWKFEFINEVYNTLALALTEQYWVPKNFRQNSTALMRLLRLPMDKLKDIVPFVFGDRATFLDGDQHDPVAIQTRKRIARLEKQLRFAKYSIEKCYLYHQIASIHLSHGRFDECGFIARKAIRESHNCNSLIWKFLNRIQIVKANTLQHKVERTGEALALCAPIAKALKSPTLIKFIELCVVCNDDDFAKKLSMISSQRSSKASSVGSLLKL